MEPHQSIVVGATGTDRATVMTVTADTLPREAMSESAKWQFSVDNALKLAALGCIAGGTVGFLVAKSPSVRAAMAMYGGGFGVGKAYVDARYIFGHDVRADAHWIASAKAEQ